jgi:hypothetical protein
LRFDDRLTHVLLHALCLFALAPTGFRQRDLLPFVAQLPGRDPATYAAGQMTYDLRRLRLHDLLVRVPLTSAIGIRSPRPDSVWRCSRRASARSAPRWL